MIDRYLTPEMRWLWSTSHRWAIFLKVEQEVLRVLAQMGWVPQEAYEASLRVKIDEVDIARREATLKHDVLAFVEHCAQQMGPWGRYFHWGLTSSDVIDTALHLLVAQSLDVILRDLRKLLSTALRHFESLQGVLTVGRTHGQWAQLTSVALKGSRFLMEWERCAYWILNVRKTLAVAKLSGPVGTYSLLPPEVEEQVAQALGLRPELVASQVVSRDRLCDVYYVMARLLSCYENFALELRHLQRSEVQEAFEPFQPGQKGSSVMPHKRNPVLSENLSGLARMARAMVTAGLENISLWHERDISHSSVERVFLADSLALGHFATVRVNEILNGLEWNHNQLSQRVEQAKGYLLIAHLLNAAVLKGADRSRFYEHLQRLAFEADDDHRSLWNRLKNDATVLQYLSEPDLQLLEASFTQLTHESEIWERVKARVNRIVQDMDSHLSNSLWISNLQAMMA